MHPAALASLAVVSADWAAAEPGACPAGHSPWRLAAAEGWLAGPYRLESELAQVLPGTSQVSAAAAVGVPAVAAGEGEAGSTAAAAAVVVVAAAAAAAVVGEEAVRMTG